MDRKTYLDKIIKEFEKWWVNDPHSSNVDFYKKTISYTYLTSLTKGEFIDFFYEFVNDGGLVQSGGERTKNLFRETLLKNFESFKQFILAPFQDEFSLKHWFFQLENYSGFGVGIATIYLNRINYKKYPVMNNKTLNALNKLGYKISSSKNWANYELVKKYQANLINDYPILKNYFKADSLNHYLVAVHQGTELISDYQQIETFENELQQHEIEQDIEINLEDFNKQDLFNNIMNCENDKSDKITINGKVYKRHNYLMVLIKKYRDHKCQFCSTQILKANGGYYIEACHIKAKAKGGKDSLENILVLCPNCHKLFDYGNREKEKHTKDSYSTTINGKKYNAVLK